MGFPRQEYWSGLPFPPPGDLPNPGIKHLLCLLHCQRISYCWAIRKVLTVVWSEVKSLSHVQLFGTPWTVVHQVPLSMGFSRQEYWSGLPFPSPGDLPNPGIEPGSPALQADALPPEPPGKPGRCFSFILLLHAPLLLIGTQMSLILVWALGLFCFVVVVVVVQSLSRVQLFATPWTAAHQASLSLTISRILCKFMSIELVMPSNHLILCCHPLLCLQSFPASGSFQWVGSLHQVTKVLELQHQSFQWNFRVDFP